MKTEKQLKSFRIELQKTQEQQEQRRIQQETAKVFLGTVIQRGETNTRLLKTIRLRIITIQAHLRARLRNGASNFSFLSNFHKRNLKKKKL